MKEGEPGNYFCFVIEGELRIVKKGHLLNVLSVGDCFGEMALFAAGRGARTASVETTTETRILTIRAPALLRASALCQMHFYKGFWKFCRPGSPSPTTELPAFSTASHLARVDFFDTRLNQDVKKHRHCFYSLLKSLP
jgi:hypothetical protein